MLFFIILYIPYRIFQRKKLVQQYNNDIYHLTDQKTQIDRRQRVLPIQMHLAGVFLDHYNNMRNDLMSKYNCMISFVGNLKKWQNEEEDTIHKMSADSRPPFVSILKNDTLDAYFEQNAQQATCNIHLADLFNNNYTLDENGIINFWRYLNNSISNELALKLNDFSMYKYVLKVQSYPFLHENVEISELLPELDSKSNTFVRWQEFDAPTPELRFIMLAFENDNEEAHWKPKTSSLFHTNPGIIKVSSKKKLIMLKTKYLTPKEVILT